MSTLQQSYIERLIGEIDNLVPIVDTLLDNSSIYYDDPNADNGNSRIVVFSFGPKYHWKKKDERTQVHLKEKYQKFYRNFSLLIPKANPQTAEKLKKANEEIINLIEQNIAPKSIELGKADFRKQTKVFKDFIDLLTTADKQILIIPDTNAIIQFPEPKDYKLFTTIDTFQFIILPTVLSELDKLKITHRDDRFRDKVKSVIKRLKGYRSQGNILEGVTVNGTITVKMIATEPNFQNTLNWIDSENKDDRIIASALELQIQNPSQNVILITSDINLQNKAQLANLNYKDTDDIQVEKTD